MFRTAQGTLEVVDTKQGVSFHLTFIPKSPKRWRITSALLIKAKKSFFACFNALEYFFSGYDAWVLTHLLTYFSYSKWNLRVYTCLLNKQRHKSITPKQITDTDQKTFWKWEDHELYLLLLLERNKCSFQSNFVEDTFLPPTWLIDILLTISQSFVTVPESS